MHRPTVMAGSLPSHWGQTPSSASGGASQSPKPSVTPSNQGTPQNNYPQQQQQRQQQAGFTQQQSQGINSQPQERSNSRWGSATTQDSTPIGRPIPVVGSDREGGTPSTPWQQAAAKGVGPAQAGDCMPGFIDPALPKDFMKILTRTVYVGGITPGITKEQVRDLFETIARVDTVTVNYPKFNAFVKLLTRAEADLIKERFHKYMFNGTMLKMGWGCGYGPKEFFDYASGETLFPMARMTDVERRTISQSPRGGGMIEGGMVVEEPDFGWPQKGEVCKGKYAAGTMPHAPGYLAAVQQRERGGFNNQAAAGAAPGGGGYNPRQNYMTPPGMPQIPRAAPSLQGRDSGMVGMPPGMPPQFQGMPRQPYRQSPHGAMHGSGGNGGIMVVTDRQYDEREERWRPKQQQQDRGEEHVVVLGGGTDSDEDTKGKDDSNNNDEHHNRGGGGDHDRDHRSNSSSSAGGYDAYHRMPPGMAPHFPYPPMMFGPGGYPMPPRPPPHWGRSPVPYPAAGGRPQWGPSSSSSSPSPAQDWNGTMPGGGMPPRKRQYSPDDNQQRDEDDKEKGEDRRDGDEEGRRQRTRWE
ncbi:hypothetical protein DFJ77DRAFT_118225 [Powellomyces hirtus]|nr:hypothetical protein DFJ77DRAFT_118225 [Powellomyces hirtus]